MTKQERANKLFVANRGEARKEVISLIKRFLSVSDAHASTLYQNARKKFGEPTVTTTPANGATNTPTTTSITSSPGKITQFDRPNCRLARAAAKRALAVLEDELGVSVDLGHGSFSQDEFTVKLRLVVTGGEDVAQRDWNQYCRSFGLKPEQFGTTFESRGTTFTVCGIKPLATRFPVIAINANGTKYKFPANMLPGGLAPPPRRPRGSEWVF